MGPLVEEWDTDLHSGDPLDFPGYAQALKDAPEESVRTGLTEHHVLIESRFDAFGGSMGWSLASASAGPSTGPPSSASRSCA